MAKPIDLAWKYMESFFSEAPLEGMEKILAENLIFEGPFHKSESAREYLASLYENPPRNVRYEIEETFETENSVCFVYQFSKPGVTTRMAQTFEIKDEKICKIKLVFDSNAFT